MKKKTTQSVLEKNLNDPKYLHERYMNEAYLKDKNMRLQQMAQSQELYAQKYLNSSPLNEIGKIQIDDVDLSETTIIVDRNKTEVVGKIKVSYLYHILEKHKHKKYMYITNTGDNHKINIEYLIESISPYKNTNMWVIFILNVLDERFAIKFSKPSLKTFFIHELPFGLSDE